jgi:hypothetical protein
VAREEEQVEPEAQAGLVVGGTERASEMELAVQAVAPWTFRSVHWARVQDPQWHGGVVHARVRAPVDGASPCARVTVGLVFGAGADLARALASALGASRVQAAGAAQ